MSGDPIRQARVEALAREHHITIEWTRRDNSAIAAKRLVRLVPPVDDETEAGCLHEIGHVVNGVCPMTGDHVGVYNGDSYGCLKCEEMAWTRAETFRTFTGRMHIEKRDSLATYRRSRRIPQPAAVARSVDRLMDFMTTYARPLQAKVEMDMRREWLRDLQREIEAQPNSIVNMRARLDRAMRGQ